jgi:sensor histidine kinase YesM
MIQSEKSRWVKIVLRHLRDIIFVTLIGTLFAINFSWNKLSLNVFLFDLLYSFMIGASLWKGNEFFAWLHEKHYPHPDNPGKMLKLSLIRVTVFSILNIFFINWIWIVCILNAKFWHYLLHRGGYLIILIELMITFLFALTFLAKEYFKAWRAAVRNEEKFKREALSMQYEALKNQVNPHFLFNSLNALTTLVETDTKKSVKFIKQLSEVYRYVLEQKDKELVELDTELKFVESYIFLQQIRYGNNLIFHNNLIFDDSFIRKHKVIPLSLQILVENAIKHNIISEEKPLTVEIFIDDDFIVVKNNLQKRSAVDSSGNIGLNNIKSRYEYLTDKKFQVNESDGYFVVKIPIIKQ